MAESLILRVKRIVTGGVAGIVGELETAWSESVMRESLREVERSIDEVRGEVGRVAAKRALASRQVTMIRDKAANFTQKARIALGEDRADLAEALIARQIDLETQIPIIEGAERDARAEETELAQALQALQGRKRDMEADLEAFVAARRVVSNEAAGSAAASGPSHRSDKASEAFDRALKSAGGGATSTADAETAAKLAEFDVLLRRRDITERLAALRREG